MEPLYQPRLHPFKKAPNEDVHNLYHPHKQT